MTTNIALGQRTLIGRGRTAEIYAWDQGRALKLYYSGWPADAVNHEAEISQVVAATGVTVPAVEGVLTVDGRQGVLFERLIGPSLLAQVAGRPWTLPRAVRVFTDLHLAVHAHTVADGDIPSQRARLVRQIEEAPSIMEEVRRAALQRLERLPDGDALCHGDYHPDNVLVTQRGPIIIDWVSATRGHPLADVAQTDLLLRIGEPPETRSRVERGLLAVARGYVRRTYLRRYLRLRSARQVEFAAWRLPITVARLAEEIPGEREQLLQLIAQETAGRGMTA
jgi:Ser/Thr protein kinase RdoA (MazF antagonist)